MTKDKQTKVKPGSFSRTQIGSRPYDEQTTWRKLDEQRPKSELEVELETVITEGLVEFDNQPIPVVGILEEPELSLKFMDPVEDFSLPPAYPNPPVVESGDITCWMPDDAPEDLKKLKPDQIVKKIQDRLKANNSGYGQEKYQHQINVKLTDEDMKRANAIKADIFSDEVSGSQLMRIFIRKGMKKYENK